MFGQQAFHDYVHHYSTKVPVSQIRTTLASLQFFFHGRLLLCSGRASLLIPYIINSSLCRTPFFVFLN